MKAPSPFQAFRWRWKRRREHCPSSPTPSPVVIFLFTVSLRRPYDLNTWTGVTHKRFRIRGVARIFQRVGHRGYSPDCHVNLHGLSCTIAVWRPRWRPILTEDKSRWRKYFTKKQILKKWAFQQWLLRPSYCHGVFATWILVVLLPFFFKRPVGSDDEK